MARYESTRHIKDKRKGVSKYGTTLYEEVPKLNSDIYVITQAGDRLDNLAFEYYGDQHLWWFIGRVNHISTINVSAGTRLRIPISTADAIGK
jgi:nucleoid-associated protein YgaU